MRGPIGASAVDDDNALDTGGWSTCRTETRCPGGPSEGARRRGAPTATNGYRLVVVGSFLPPWWATTDASISRRTPGIPSRANALRWRSAPVPS